MTDFRELSPADQADALSLLRKYRSPDNYDARLRRLEEITEAMLHAGAPLSRPGAPIVLGTAADTIRIPGKVVFVQDVVQEDGEGQAGSLNMFNAPNQVLVTDITGAQKLVTMAGRTILARTANGVSIAGMDVASNSLVGSAGSTMQDIAIGTNQAPFRGSGSLGASTAAAGDVLGRGSSGPLAFTALSSLMLNQGAMLGNFQGINYGEYAASGTFTAGGVIAMFGTAASGNIEITLQQTPTNGMVLIMLNGDDGWSGAKGWRLRRHASATYDFNNGGNPTWPGASYHDNGPKIAMAVYAAASNTWIAREIDN